MVPSTIHRIMQQLPDATDCTRAQALVLVPVVLDGGKVEVDDPSVAGITGHRTGRPVVARKGWVECSIETGRGIAHQIGPGHDRSEFAYSRNPPSAVSREARGTT